MLIVFALLLYVLAIFILKIGWETVIGRVRVVVQYCTHAYTYNYCTYKKSGGNAVKVPDITCTVQYYSSTVTTATLLSSRSIWMVVVPGTIISHNYCRTVRTVASPMICLFWSFIVFYSPVDVTIFFCFFFSFNSFIFIFFHYFVHSVLNKP